MSNNAIFVSSGIGMNQGGPSGYVYNLVQGSIENGNSIDIITSNKNISSAGEINDSAKRKLRWFPVIRSLLYILKSGIRCRLKFYENVNSKSIIHAHSSQDVFFLRMFLRYKGLLVFTPHRPEPYAEEFLHSYRITFDKANTPLLLKIVADYIERYSYKKSNRFIFPSKNARRIYYKFPGFRKYGMQKPTDYLITGTSKKVAATTKNEYRRKNKIPEDSFMITFVGRHNSVKGYDIIYNISDQLLKEKIYTVCAGSLKGVTPPKNDKWIELGYINDAPDLMNAADVVVIPNRNTYFDLVIIEALSLGKIVITSNTGGNIDIAKDTSGLVLFESESDRALMKAIIDVKKMSENEKKSRENDNVRYYNENCKLSQFAMSYINIMRNIEK